MTVKTISVLGAGQMGSGIAQIAAAGGYKIILRDVKEEFCSNAVAKIRDSLNKRIAAGKTTQESAEAILANISTSTSLEDAAKADLVIEAVPEILDLKRSTFKALGEICRPDTILCTNTSSMSVNEITAECKNPERCAGMHFFFPVTAMKLVEIIRCNATSEATLATLREVSRLMNKVSVECQTDTPGFIVNRCLFAFLLEAIHCYEDGVASIQDIDTAIKLGLNHPLGPFEMMDLSGIDTFPHVSDTLKALPITSWNTPKSINELIESGRFGRKNGKGWYDYE